MNGGRIFETELGWFGMIRDDQNRLLRLKIGYPARELLCRELEQEFEFQNDPDSEFDTQLESRLQRYSSGQEIDFRDVILFEQGLTDFQLAVIRHCRAIPFGETRSYGELAKAAGSPKASRAVGGVMAANRFPIVVPCHRVLAAGKKIGGFSAPRGVSLKRKILSLESGRQADRLLFAKD